MRQAGTGPIETEIGALVLITSALVLTTSCVTTNGGSSGKAEIAAEYVGSYEGISSGEVSVLWKIKADEAGFISGKFKQEGKIFLITGNIKKNGKFTAYTKVNDATYDITISGTVDKKSGTIFGTCKQGSKKGVLLGYKKAENAEAVDDKLFSVWELKSVRVEKESFEIKYPLETAIDESDSSKVMKSSAYFLFLENNELYNAVEISGVPNPSPVPNLSNGLFKSKQNYISAGEQIAICQDLMTMVGSFSITESKLIIDGMMKIDFDDKEKPMKSKWTFEKVSKPTVDEIKKAPKPPVIQP